MRALEALRARPLLQFSSRYYLTSFGLPPQLPISGPNNQGPSTISEHIETLCDQSKEKKFSRSTSYVCAVPNWEPLPALLFASLSLSPRAVYILAWLILARPNTAVITRGILELNYILPISYTPHI